MHLAIHWSIIGELSIVLVSHRTHDTSEIHLYDNYHLYYDPSRLGLLGLAASGLTGLKAIILSRGRTIVGVVWVIVHRGI